MAAFWPATERTRVRFGILTLVVGVLMIAWAWGSWMYRMSVAAEGMEDVAAVEQVEPEEQIEDTTPALALARLLMISFVLILVILLGTYGISRSIRRYQMRLRRERAPASDTTDIWATHRLPEERSTAASDDD